MRSQQGRWVAVLALGAIGLSWPRPAAQAQRLPRVTLPIRNYGQSNNGLSGIINIPASQLGVDDKSRTFTTISNPVDFIFAAYDQDTRNAERRYCHDAQSLAQADLSNLSALITRLNYIENIQAFNFGSEGRIGGDAPFVVTSAIFSNGHEGYDLAAEAMQGAEAGYGVAARVALTRGALTRDIKTFHHLVYAHLAKLRTCYEKHRKALTESNSEVVPLRSDHEAQREIEAARAELSVKQCALANSYVDLSRHVRVSALVGYDGLTSGNLLRYGLSASYLKPLGSGNASGLFSLFSLEGLSFFQNPNNDAVTPLAGFALGWQDHVPHLAPGDCPGETVLRGRWRVQTGVEYDFSSQFGIKDAVGLFLHWRPANQVELDLSGGESPTHHSYIGFGVSTYLRL